MNLAFKLGELSTYSESIYGQFEKYQQKGGGYDLRITNPITSYTTKNSFINMLNILFWINRIYPYGDQILVWEQLRRNPVGIYKGTPVFVKYVLTIALNSSQICSWAEKQGCHRSEIKDFLDKVS